MKHRPGARLLTLLAVLIFLGAAPRTASAADLGELSSVSDDAPTSEPSTTYKGVDYSRVYDFTYYTTHNDAAKRYAKNPERAIRHFVKKGMKLELQAIATFDPKSYRYGCPSLRAKYRNNYKKYYLHYQNKGYKKRAFRKYATGVKKMRKAVTKYGKLELKSIYSYNYYVKRYPKVVKKVGDDDKAVLAYFVKKGLKKKQTAKDPAKYKKAKPSSRTYRKLRKAALGDTIVDGEGLIVCIDPGHQLHGMSSREPIGPGSSATKAKVTSGAYGHYSHKNEYEINLEVSLKLRDELEARGYTVVMTRTTHNVQISNIERAKVANRAKADIMVRIHADDIDSSSVTGVLCYGPASSNPWLSASVIKKSRNLCTLLRNAQCAETGQNRRENLYQNDMTGINWCKMPVAIVEMGLMSNPTEDLRMANSGFQLKIARGLANGIDQYFRSEGMA